ncbi:phosphoribosylamine--glycine ligase [Clostridium sp. 'deep sea']|uniref:phosphoribosylamine--glycine ligase n=1 Tax=Clostridium sp. 'deep sea' TaxID=2779445 RepID=UPI0018965433|nr:phosphoribosylamine--glycine ligase [Clostridium sp. 'deep sea']QOR34773.1 phosphoribosylamine--glycine ligase [Clostridium sp. 'deep sea']
MKILLIGSGGREHTLAWKIVQSPLVKKLYVAPGNAGTAQIATNVDIKATNKEALLEFALQHKIDLTVVGPEQPLADGIVDIFKSQGLKVYGPNKQAAQIEASKTFAKNLMRKYSIPTADYRAFTNYCEAKKYLINQEFPIVIKADGLAAGKGVIIAKTLNEALASLKEIMQNKAFGSAGCEVVIEQFLQGQELSLLAFTDGETVLPMVTAQDHKQAYDNDKGPNTGGMGTFSPAKLLTAEQYNDVVENIMVKTVQALKSEGITYNGVLYGGLMLTKDGVKVIEFNCRFGDPEAQVVIPRLKTDIVEIMLASLNNELGSINLTWSKKTAVCVILASGGYPTKYEKGFVISGLNQDLKDTLILHAGTKLAGTKVVTNGGRVLGITALADNKDEAIKKAYKAVEKIHFEGVFYRTDIAQRKS